MCVGYVFYNVDFQSSNLWTLLNRYRHKQYKKQLDINSMKASKLYQESRERSRQAWFRILKIVEPFLYYERLSTHNFYSFFKSYFLIFFRFLSDFTFYIFSASTLSKNNLKCWQKSKERLRRSVTNIYKDNGHWKVLPTTRP